jgi:hypothetical protein
VEDPSFSTLTALDRLRGDTRRAREAKAAGSVPPVVFGFMLSLVGLALAMLTFFLPRKQRGAQIATLAAVGAVLVGALTLIYSLDHPFRGVLRIEPTEMRSTAAEITREFAAAYGARRLPCDARGAPLDAPRS